ncbi:hypothetical protein [Modestobacter roseus]|uniref:hypothetical protein n=1 Tax=Modestobacter roseus TaxID=1181884 RepID=UPI0012964FB6|nr:hypothetical protein [Modestobacter roseus]MQA34020.1 hypothetical protein [Modestobacter roseus]
MHRRRNLSSSRRLRFPALLTALLTCLLSLAAATGGLQSLAAAAGITAGAPTPAASAPTVPGGAGTESGTGTDQSRAGDQRATDTSSTAAAAPGTPESVPADVAGTVPGSSSTAPGTPAPAPAAAAAPAPSSTPAPAAAPSAGTPEPAPAGPATPANADLDADAWAQAWSTGDTRVLRSWFDANTGPTRTISGTTGGGKIRSQADADRLAGKTVTSDLSVDCTCVLQEFALVHAQLTIEGGRVDVRNLLIDGKNDTEMVGVFTARGSSQVEISRVEITGHNDGIRAYASSVTGSYVYIHGVAPDNPREHHQDGIQTIGGGSAFSRSYIDMTGAHTSATLIKPDASPIPYARINQTAIMGGGYTFHVHDGPKGTPRNVDLSDNLVAPGYRNGLVSTWKLSNVSSVVLPTVARVAGSSRTVALVDGAKL